MYDLVIAVIASTLLNPKPHLSLKVSAPYHALQQCLDAGDALDLKELKKDFLRARKGAGVLDIKRTCVPHEVIEPNRDCEWQLRCSNFIFKT